jgi:hypothetical protein
LFEAQQTKNYFNKKQGKHILKKREKLLALWQLEEQVFSSQRSVFNEI